MEQSLTFLKPSLIRSQLATEIIGKRIIYLRSVDSTNACALEMAARGIPEGTVVVAEQQTRGKGRLGRQWHSPPGKGIYLSIVLRPRIKVEFLTHFSIISALAVAETVEGLSPLTPDIKWPNDVLLQNKKVAGVLVELGSENDSVSYLIVGIGINLFQKEDDFPDELRDKATSILIEGGKVSCREEVVVKLLQNFDHWYKVLLTSGVTPILERWKDYSHRWIGKEVKVVTPEGEFFGISEGVGDDGRFLVRKGDGELKEVWAADIVSLQEVNK